MKLKDLLNRLDKIKKMREDIGYKYFEAEYTKFEVGLTYLYYDKLIYIVDVDYNDYYGKYEITYVEVEK